MLLARPPEGKYNKYVASNNFDHADDQERCKILWNKWEQQYCWKNSDKDLIDQAIRGKMNQKKKTVTSTLMAYGLTHFTIKFGINTYPTSHFTKTYGAAVFKALRVTKYVAFMGYIYGQYYNA